MAYDKRAAPLGRKLNFPNGYDGTLLETKLYLYPRQPRRYVSRHLAAEGQPPLPGFEAAAAMFSDRRGLTLQYDLDNEDDGALRQWLHRTDRPGRHAVYLSDRFGVDLDTLAFDGKGGYTLYMPGA